MLFKTYIFVCGLFNVTILQLHLSHLRFVFFPHKNLSILKNDIIYERPPIVKIIYSKLLLESRRVLLVKNFANFFPKTLKITFVMTWPNKIVKKENIYNLRKQRTRSRSYQTFFLRKQRIFSFFATKLGHCIIHTFFLFATNSQA